VKERSEEAKNTSRLFGALSVCCLISAALGFYWYFTSGRLFGVLICAVMLFLLGIGGYIGWRHYSIKVKNFADKNRKGASRS
jgi:hypothetical protein